MSDNCDGHAKGTTSGFADADAFAQFGRLVTYLDFLAEMPQIQRLRQASYAMERIAVGHKVLDVGCGTGTTAEDLAELVGPTGQVVGVDFSERMVELAKERSHCPNCTFAQGDAQDLRAYRKAFDSSRAERCLMYLTDPPTGLSELVSTVRTGGRVVVLEPDLGTLILHHPDQPTTALVRDYLTDMVMPNGRFLRSVPTVLSDLGCTSLEVRAETIAFADFQAFDQCLTLSTVVERLKAAGILDESECAAWLEAADTEGAFFGAVTCFAVAATVQR